MGNPDFDWNFVTVPQEALGGLQVAQPRGKMLGGSSGLNFMVWNRASEGDYNAWEQVRGPFEQETPGSDPLCSWAPQVGIGVTCFRTSRNPKLSNLPHPTLSNSSRGASLTLAPNFINSMEAVVLFRLARDLAI